MLRIMGLVYGIFLLHNMTPHNRQMPSILYSKLGNDGMFTFDVGLESSEFLRDCSGALVISITGGPSLLPTDLV